MKRTDNPDGTVTTTYDDGSTLTVDSEGNLTVGCHIVGDRCIPHNAKADLGHYLDTRPKSHNGHNPVSGIAYND